MANALYESIVATSSNMVIRYFFMILQLFDIVIIVLEEMVHGAFAPSLVVLPAEAISAVGYSLNFHLM